MTAAIRKLWHRLAGRPAPEPCGCGTCTLLRLPFRSQYAREWQANIREAEAAGVNIHGDGFRFEHAPPTWATLASQDEGPWTVL